MIASMIMSHDYEEYEKKMNLSINAMRK